MDEGYAIVEDVMTSDECDSLSQALTDSPHATRAGIRHCLSLPAVSRLATSSKLQGIAASALGRAAIPFRATLFAKKRESNWAVVWHQDTALPLKKRVERAGWGPWSVKDGVAYAHAPADALSRVVALRVHLDDSTADNGPLRVLPGTHRLGVLTDDAVGDLAKRMRAVECLVPRRGVLVMRPLIVHASAKLAAPLPRRVLHIEYADALELAPGLELAIA